MMTRCLELWGCAQLASCWKKFFVLIFTVVCLWWSSYHDVSREVMAFATVLKLNVCRHQLRPECLTLNRTEHVGHSYEEKVIKAYSTNAPKTNELSQSIDDTGWSTSEGKHEATTPIRPLRRRRVVTGFESGCWRWPSVRDISAGREALACNFGWYLEELPSYLSHLSPEKDWTYWGEGPWAVWGSFKGGHESIRQPVRQEETGFVLFHSRRGRLHPYRPWRDGVSNKFSWNIWRMPRTHLALVYLKQRFIDRRSLGETSLLALSATLIRRMPWAKFLDGYTEWETCRGTKTGGEFTASWIGLLRFQTYSSNETRKICGKGE